MQASRSKKANNKKERDRRELIEHSCGIYEEDSGTEDRATVEGTENARY